MTNCLNMTTDTCSLSTCMSQSNINASMTLATCENLESLDVLKNCTYNSKYNSYTCPALPATSDLLSTDPANQQAQTTNPRVLHPGVVIDNKCCL